MHLQFKRRRISAKVLWAVGAALVLLIAVPATLAILDTGIKRDQYQLIKLTTGELFFGKLQNSKGDYLTLENAYFIQGGEDASETTILSRKSTVAKGESPMRIKGDKVVYWENLAKDGKISQSIQNAAGN